VKVLVTIKQVAEATDEFELSGGDIDESYLSYDLNEWDNYALEEAVAFAEEEDDVEVVTVTVGPERSEETIRMALAKGADRAIRVWDEAIAEREWLDAETKAELLAAVAREEDPDLVFTGVQASDDGFGATGVALAEKIGFEWAAVVNSLAIDREADGAHVHRELEGGVEELVDVELPAVFTVQTGINEPRYASMRGIRRAQGQPLEVRDMADIGLSAADLDSPLRRLSARKPESEGDATFFEGSHDETAGELAGVLRERGVGE